MDTDYLAVPRRKSRQIMVGDVAVGGDAPISVQSMTNTDTADAQATIDQVRRLAEAGADIVRVSVPDDAAADAFHTICRESPVPIVADIHFDYTMAIRAADGGAACLRLNPGNIGKRERVAEVIASARHHGIPIRIGVNAGSLERDLQQKYGEPNPDALVESAQRHIGVLDSFDFHDYKVSIKASDVRLAVASYRQLAVLTDAPLHVGITEAGGKRSGTVKSAVGMGSLLLEGIGDTIRVSLAADPVAEVKVGWDLLKSLRLRTRGVNLVACPSCSRQNFDVIGVVNELERRFENISEPIDVAVIGCYVNGPGESKVAQVGVTGASPQNMIYVDGNTSHKVNSDQLVDEIEAQVRRKLRQREDRIPAKVK